MMKKTSLPTLVCILITASAGPATSSLERSTIDATSAPHLTTTLSTTRPESQKLLPTNGRRDDDFGWAVALDGNHAVLGAPCHDYPGFDAGIAYVFTRTDTTWSEHEWLLASDGSAYDLFGYAVAIDGNTAIIGAPGNAQAAYVFVRSPSGLWSQQAKLRASDGAYQATFATSVAIEGNSALIGKYGDEINGNVGAGSAYVFIRTGSTWRQQQQLIAPDGAADDHFGFSVSLSRDTAFIGATGDNDYAGSVYVFTRMGATWLLRQKLMADSTCAVRFGRSVSLDRGTALISAHRDHPNANTYGTVYVFTRTAAGWKQQATLVASDGEAGQYFGMSVSLSGDTALIGAEYDDDNGIDAGAAYLFTRMGTTWTQRAKLLTSDGAAGDLCGFAVALDGDIGLVGAYHDDDQGVDSGSAYVFRSESERTDGATHPVTATLSGGENEESEMGCAGPVLSIHPNPFSAKAWISLFGSTAGRSARVAVFDIDSRLIRDLTPTVFWGSGAGEDGFARVSWDGLDSSGRPAPSGIYFVRVSDGKDAVIRHFIRLR